MKFGLLLLTAIATYSTYAVATTAEADRLAAKIVADNVNNLPVQLNANMSMESFMHLAGGGLNVNTRLHYTMAYLNELAGGEVSPDALKQMKNAMEKQAQQMICNNNDPETRAFYRAGGWAKINYIFQDGEVLHTFRVSC